MPTNTLDEAFIASERLLERRLAGIALSCPKAVAQMETRPQIDQDAVSFFERFDGCRDQILAASEDTALLIANQCATYRLYVRFRDALIPMPKADRAMVVHVWRGTETEAELEAVRGDLEGINPFIACQTIEMELIASRAARKAINWLQASGIVREVLVYEE
ncbi:MAG: hypothetical protein GYA20_07430 [Chloroflexi bacterium]|nr:hypothetical protein [Chloroflexota bacterium]